MQSRNIRVPAALALMLGIGFGGAAGAQSPTAAISGDAKAGDVAIVRNADTGFSREVKVKDNGHYQLRNLPTGTFLVVIRHPDGSLDPPRQVTLKVGSTARVQ